MTCFAEPLRATRNATVGNIKPSTKEGAGGRSSRERQPAEHASVFKTIVTFLKNLNQSDNMINVLYSNPSKKFREI